MGKIRGTHSSPGIYDQISDLQYAADHLGLTTLGLVGETLKGPAFEPIEVTKWDEYVDYFGGTSAEKFKGSQYPKYELPYIAKSYLKASEQLYVCRVLGLSGYNAGKAFVITASNGSGVKYPILVLRSRGKQEDMNTADPCNPTGEAVDFACDEVRLERYEGISISYSCSDSNTANTETKTFSIDSLQRGVFTVVCYKNQVPIGRYSVSLNPGAKDYVYNVLGSNAANGNAAVFVEELYDYMLEELIADNKVNQIDSNVTTYQSTSYAEIIEADSFLNFSPDQTTLKRKEGKKVLFANAVYPSGVDLPKTVKKNDGSNYYTLQNTTVEEGAVYKIIKYKTSSQSQDYYGFEEIGKVGSFGEQSLTGATVNGSIFALQSGKVSQDVDFSNYHEQFRCASTPWIVSDVKGDAKHPEVKKLFRFHTISDGNAANTQVKISIANVSFENGTFDVYVRDFYDSDGNPVILESYKNVNMVPGNNKYIGLQIGTLDGSYELRSKYVVLELIEDEMTRNCVPAGFLGYPTRNYKIASSNIALPYFKYNKMYNENIKDRKQYFGLSDLTGVDEDMLNYKGRDAYAGEGTDQSVGYTDGFHLDATLSKQVLEASNGVATVDGNEGFTFDTVSIENVTSSGENYPRITFEDQMKGTIYENIKLRKFTVYPYGGFDGWDIYSDARSNGDQYKANKYKGVIGKNNRFSKIEDGLSLSLTGNCITSDYYAYLAGISQFENPEKFEINLFATPGIDYVNNKLLVHDALDMVENRADTFYIPTTPDKQYGESDAIEDMYSASEAAANLQDSELDSYYAATYYPWVKYFDRDNSIYVNLPATKDVVRVMANTDNKRFPWIAPAGFERGTVECTKMHFYAKLEDRDTLYDDRINALMSFGKEGTRIWGNKTMYICDETNPMNRINAVRLLLYMRKLIRKSARGLIFEPNDGTLKQEYESIVKPILDQIKADRGITEYRLKVEQTPEQMDMHELSCKLFVKPTPDLEYIEIDFVVTPQGVQFDDIS